MTTTASKLTPLRIALDWTPNTLHTGLYLAVHQNLYRSAGLDVQLVSPAADNYSSTPAKKLFAGDVDLAICPSESCIAYAEAGKMQLQAVYAILQDDASAIVSARFPRMGMLGEGEGGVYGSYGARYEDAIVRSMVSHAGGDGGKMRVGGEEKLGLFEALLKGDGEGVDATWVFLPWEGVEAEMSGRELYSFVPGDYGVPYCYSPVIARNADASPSGEVLRAFCRATAEGYRLAMLRENLEMAVEVVGKICEPRREEGFLRRSQERVGGFYASRDGREGGLGKMRGEKWEEWVKWLREKGLLEGEVRVEALFTNEFLE